LIKHLGLKFVVEKAISNAEKIIVPSKAVGRDLIDIHNADKNKLKVIYEGVSIMGSEKESLTLPDKFIFQKKYFLYIGNAYPHKNLERLIEAVKTLNLDRKDKILLVIGGSRDVFKKKLREYIKDKNSEQYVKTVGYIPEEYMKTLYENSVAFVYPSLAEGFGLQGIEAMKAGTLLLASDIPVFKEIYKDNAIYFNPYDFSKIVFALKEALNMSDKKRKKLIERAQKFSERYAWRKMAWETLRVYNSVK
jgi:glycosyltransferase involved in cell wall biosynthesis